MPEQDEAPRARARAGHAFLHPRAASGRLMIAAGVAAFATMLTPDNVAIHVRAMVGWDAGALTFLVLAWLLIARASPSETRRRAAMEDPGRRFVFVISVVASVFSLGSAINVIRALHTLPAEKAPIWSGLAITAVVLSWFVTHTAYTLSYAHLYFEEEGERPCLRFEGTTEPTDLDFAYFAFTLGMCFQVSDVVVASSRARSYVLGHAILSFGYNTTILALALNLVTTLLG